MVVQITDWTNRSNTTQEILISMTLCFAIFEKQTIMQITDWMNRSNTPKTPAGSCNYMQRTVNGGVCTNLRCTLLQHACTLDSFLYLQGLFWGGGGGGSMSAWSLGAWCRCGSVCVPGQELDMVCILVRVGWEWRRGHCGQVVWLCCMTETCFLAQICLWDNSFYIIY